jgi:hypothetical protein
MAAADISSDIFRETVVTTVPKMQKTNTMERRRDGPFDMTRLSGFFFIVNLHSGVWETRARFRLNRRSSRRVM